VFITQTLFLQLTVYAAEYRIYLIVSRKFIRL